MNPAILLVVITTNAFFIYLFIPNEGFVYSFFASAVIATIFAPFIAIEYLLFDSLFSLIDKKE
jgi:hypothetical protein